MAAIKITCSVMKVGNSAVMTLPKVLLQNYPIKVGEKIEVWATDNGLFINLKQKEFEFDTDTKTEETNGSPFP